LLCNAHLHIMFVNCHGIVGKYLCHNLATKYWRCIAGLWILGNVDWGGWGRLFDLALGCKRML